MKKLYLLPNLLADLPSHREVLALEVDLAVITLDHLIAESEKQARRYLKRFCFPADKSWREIPLYLWNEHTTSQEKQSIFSAMQKGGNWGVLSDCGMPCLADPGSDLVLGARKIGFSIHAFSGPSSILLALVLSGFSAQKFSFHGYLPKEEAPFLQALKKLEQHSAKEGSSEVFMETPYRNQSRLKKMVDCLQPNTWLSVSSDLTAPTEETITQSIKEWRTKPLPQIDRRPSIFVLRAYTPRDSKVGFGCAGIPDFEI